MYIDTHCHIDLFDDPVTTVGVYQNASALCVMATMLPTHYQLALPHVKQYNSILPALGMHPLRASEGRHETGLFKSLASSVEWVGEIGLDFSKEGLKTKDIQLSNLGIILPSIANGKFVTVHSRNAHDEVLDILKEFNIGPVCFHYFIGGPRAAEKIAEMGHYFSINHRMLLGKHKYLLDLVPKERLLVESDGPFLTKKPLSMITHVYEELCKYWQLDKYEVTKIITQNFYGCRTR